MPHFSPTTGLDADRLANLIVHGIAGDAASPSDVPALARRARRIRLRDRKPHPCS